MTKQGVSAAALAAGELWQRFTALIMRMDVAGFVTMSMVNGCALRNVV
ncbi:hypothetical protein A2U01_0056594, partial [Trifolium medium]|nr:hypothetical protein [Trifolium medium]